MELKAETLVSLLDINNDIYAQMEGVFSRNYSEDLLDVVQNIENTTISLSRDGIFHLLPEKLFFEDNFLKKDGKRYFDFNDEYEELKKKKNELLSFFQPLDSTFFKQQLEIEQKLNYFAETGNLLFLKNIYNDSVFETDKYIGKLIKLIPFTSQIRGNLQLIADLLKIIIPANKIEINEIEPFNKRFIIHIENLSKEEYLKMDKELVLLFKFLHHWFLPVEIKCDFRIKDFNQPLILGETLILDYNTNL